MIVSFRCRDTEKFFHNQPVRRFISIAKQARIKLKLLHAIDSLDDLRSPPGNRLETLKGTRQGQYSIRINKQWRICFNWHENNAHDVEIIDYH